MEKNNPKFPNTSYISHRTIFNYLQLAKIKKENLHRTNNIWAKSMTAAFVNILALIRMSIAATCSGQGPFLQSSKKETGQHPQLAF